jgi:hypothetical protein
VHTQNCDEWPLLHSICNNHLHKATLHLPPADNWGITWSLWNWRQIQCSLKKQPPQQATKSSKSVQKHL